MRTVGKRLTLKDIAVTSDTAVISDSPLTFDISSGILSFDIKQNGETEWNENEYLILDLEVSATSRVFISVDFFNNGEFKTDLNYSVIPGRRVKVAFPLYELVNKRWYLTPNPGNLKGHVVGSPSHISKIDCVKLITRKIRDAKTFTIYDMYVSDKLPDFTVLGSPMVDKFGQNKDMEFSGKVHSEEELVTYLKSEYEKALADSSYPSDDWDEYGGYKKLKFDKTGYFHTHFDGKRHWLVDPEGNAFLSNGVCYASRMGVHGFVDGMENLFEWLPSKDDAVFGKAWVTAGNIPEFVKRNGEDAGKSRYLFNFARANMMRAFGDKWWDAWCTINSARLKKWGFNTISVCVNNYFDENVYEYLKKAKIPYTWTLKKFPKTENHIFRDFPDVFSEEYREKCKEFAKQLEPLANDKYMIGYFINNEPEWLASRVTNIAERLIVSSAKLESKKAFADYIANKYKTVEAFVKAWEYEISDFSQLTEPFDEDFKKNDIVLADLNAFRDILIDEYNKVPLYAVKQYAPDALCLGMRYANVQKGDFAGSDYFDSFSFNCYSLDPDQMMNVACRGTNVPFMIGEWHIGAADSNLLCSCLVSVKNEEERGKACFTYLAKCFKNPQCIGAHYFEYNDQPYLGRFDGEAMPHGLIDICNKPHECVEYFRRINKVMYEVATGKIQPETYEIDCAERF